MLGLHQTFEPGIGEAVSSVGYYWDPLWFV